MDGLLNKILRPLDAASITAFLTPRSIAVIGAAPAEQRSIRGMLLRVLRRAGFTGRIAPVNPSYREVNGLPCYPAIAAVTFPIDLAIVAVPAELVCDIVEQCAVAGVRWAIVISSGFAEESAAKAERQLRLSEIARRTGIRICGPNCEGFYNVPGRVAATFSTAIEPSLSGSTQNAAGGRVAIVAQSGGLGFSLLSRGAPPASKSAMSSRRVTSAISPRSTSSRTLWAIPTAQPSLLTLRRFVTSSGSLSRRVRRVRREGR